MGGRLTYRHLLRLDHPYSTPTRRNAPRSTTTTRPATWRSLALLANIVAARQEVDRAKANVVKTEAAARDSIGQAKALQAAAEARLAEAVTWPPFSLMTLRSVRREL